MTQHLSLRNEDICVPLEHIHNVIEHGAERLTNPVSGSKENFSEMATFVLGLEGYMVGFSSSKKYNGILNREKNQCKGKKSAFSSVWLEHKIRTIN